MPPTDLARDDVVDSRLRLLQRQKFSHRSFGGLIGPVVRVLLNISIAKRRASRLGTENKSVFIYTVGNY